jgi:hypothetical protein
MKRLAVSVLFILIAATFTPDAIGAFEKLRSWTGRLRDCGSIQIHNRARSRDSAPPRAYATKVSSSQEGCLQGVVVKLAGSDNRSESFESIRRAARQINEVLGLMRIK